MRLIWRHEAETGADKKDEHMPGMWKSRLHTHNKNKMAIIIPDIKIRKVGLTSREIEWLIEALEYQPHNVFEFLNHQRLVDKLKEVK